MSSLETKYLIEKSLFSVAKKALKSDPHLDICLQTIDGMATVSGGSFGSQDIESLAWSDSEIAFITSVYNEINQPLSRQPGRTVI